MSDKERTEHSNITACLAPRRAGEADWTLHAAAMWCAKQEARGDGHVRVTKRTRSQPLAEKLRNTCRHFAHSNTKCKVWGNCADV